MSAYAGALICTLSSVRGARPGSPTPASSCGAGDAGARSADDEVAALARGRGGHAGARRLVGNRALGAHHVQQQVRVTAHTGNSSRTSG